MSTVFPWGVFEVGVLAEKGSLKNYLTSLISILNIKLFLSLPALKNNCIIQILFIRKNQNE